MPTQQVTQVNKGRKPPKAEPPFRVGDRVSFQFVFEHMTGVVVEDCGKIGAGGRHLYRVEAPFDDGNLLVTEMPAERLQPA